MEIVKELMGSFFKVCEGHEVDYTWFNFALHKDSIEIYTAEEHDDYMFHGNMGCDAKNFNDILRFCQAVKTQNIYYRKKEEE